MITKKEEAIIINHPNTCRIYENLEQEFKQELNRVLTDKEKYFLEWLAQKAADDTPSSFRR